MDWSHILVNPQFLRRENEVVWTNFAPRILNYPILRSDVAQLIDDGQYTFQIIEDGSVIQIHYLCKGDKILKATLSFYNMSSFELNNKAFVDENNSIEDVMLLDSFAEGMSIIHEEPFQNAPDENEPIGWLRIDYDPASS